MTDEPLAKAIAEMCDCAHVYGMSWAAIHEAVIDAAALTLQQVESYDDHSDSANLLTWLACAQEGTLSEEDAGNMRDVMEAVIKQSLGGKEQGQ